MRENNLNKALILFVFIAGTAILFSRFQIDCKYHFDNISAKFTSNLPLSKFHSDHFTIEVANLTISVSYNNRCNTKNHQFGNFYNLNFFDFFKRGVPVSNELYDGVYIYKLAMYLHFKQLII